MESVARIGIFKNPTPEQAEEAEANLTKRLIPAIRQQPGFVRGIWATTEAQDRAIAFATFTHADAAAQAGRAINSAPLQAGQNSENIPTPTEVHLCEVVDAFSNDLMPGIVRLGYQGKANVNNLEAEQHWVQETLLPFLKQQSGLCAAYMLRNIETNQRISFTVWDSPNSLAKAGSALAQWMQNQPTDFHTATNETNIYDVILHNVSGEVDPLTAG